MLPEAGSRTLGDRERAKSLLTEARAFYEEIGMLMHVERVDKMLEEAS